MNLYGICQKGALQKTFNLSIEKETGLLPKELRAHLKLPALVRLAKEYRMKI